ncbi:MAG TPA: ABC transporter permease [Planctomycetota bacterium]|nr:ABC transporter permease [Planctomycetota bacterium]
MGVDNHAPPPGAQRPRRGILERTGAAFSTLWSAGVTGHRNVLEQVGAGALRLTEAIGHDALLFARSVVACGGAFRKRREIARQMFICGVMSFPVVVLVAIFAGAVLALQAGLTLRPYGIAEKIGAIVAASMTREMGPIMCALILAGRVGSAMAAELGTMRVSEEIDALHAMSIDPVRFLVMPRLVTMFVMAPVLTVFADLIGVLGGAVVAYHQVGVSYTAYFNEAENVLVLVDLNSSVIKAMVFGTLIAVVGCGRGLRAASSAEGVGKATKDSVVASFILIIIFNYLITSIVQHLY